MLNKRFKIDINPFSVLIALVAWMLVFLWRDSCQLNRELLTFLQPFSSILLALVAFWMGRKVMTERQADLRVLPFAAVGLAIPFLIGYFERDKGAGTPWEVLSMIVFANWTLTLSMFSRFERYQNLTAIFAGTATFVVVSMIEGLKYSLLGGAYGLLVLWWSMTNYWQKLEQKFADNQRSELSTRGVVFLVSAVCMGFLGALVVGLASTGALDIKGFSWFSGGNRFSDEYARDGVGAGDGIRAATENPMTFGPVDTDIFMESHQPTLFDVTSEMYGAPHKPRKSSRAVGIEAEVKKNDGSRVARSQQATGEFSVARKPKANRQATAEDQLAKVLLYYKGEAPALLALETYNHFEDGYWLHLPPDLTQKEIAGQYKWNTRLTDSFIYKKVTLEPLWGKPWMKLQRFENSTIFGGWESAGLKIINFRSLRVPSPPCLEQFYIDRIDREDFFLVGSDGVPQLDNEGSYVPPDTVIHTVSSRINVYQPQTTPRLLDERLEKKKPELGDMLNHDFVSTEVKDLSSRWVAGAESKWEQVQTITERLRTEFEWDRDATLPEGQTDAAQFLIRNGKGTDYMFATTASFMFRAGGIPSRVVQGFWVDPSRFDRKTGHTGIVAEDLHTWVEVSLDGECWIPVEPTPGYPVPAYHLTLTQRIALTFHLCKRWIKRHPFATGMIAFALMVVAWNYRYLLNWIQTIRWSLLSWWSPDKIVLNSARLIDRRTRLAGIPRPQSQTPARFAKELASRLSTENGTIETVQRYITALNRQLYHPQPDLPRSESGNSIVQDCRTLIANLGYRKLTRLKKESKGNFSNV